jgi:hypothetical protein
MTRWPNNAPLPSDAIVAAASGDATAIRVLLRRFNPLVHRLCRAVPAQHREDAEDEVFLALLLALGSYRPRIGKDTTRPVAYKVPDFTLFQ